MTRWKAEVSYQDQYGKIIVETKEYETGKKPSSSVVISDLVPRGCETVSISIVKSK